MRKCLPPVQEWVKFLQGEEVEGEMKVAVSEKAQGKWKTPREGLFILTNFRILFVPFKIVSRTVSLIYPPSSSSPSRSSSLFLDATGVKEGLYGSFCPIIRRFPENNPIQDEDLADLVDLGAQTDQEGPPSWVKTTLKDKMGKKENLLHLAPLQWVETKGGRKGGKRSKRESGFKPRGAGLPGVVEWTNKGVCDNARIISIPLGMIYEIYELFDQNSEERGLSWPRSLPEDLLYKTAGVIQLELRSFRSLRLAFLASPRILGSLNGGKKEDAEVLEGVEKGQNGKEGEKEGTAKVEEKTELKTIETTEEAAKIEKETTEAPPPPTRTSTERHQHTNSPSHLPREQVVPQRTEGTKWGGGWWNATVAAATSALALAGGVDPTTTNPTRQRRRSQNELTARQQRFRNPEKELQEEGEEGERDDGMVKRDDVENYETCLSILYQLVFLEKKGFSSLSSSSSLSSPSQKVVSEWSPFDIRQEFLRLGFHESGYWQISDLNREYKYSETYPKRVIIPSVTEDSTLIEVASYRSKRRFPAIVWRNVGNGAILSRCSQPLTGLLRVINVYDQALVRQMRFAVRAEREEKKRRKEAQSKEKEEEEKEEEKEEGEKEGEEEGIEGSAFFNLKEDGGWFHVSGDTEDEEDYEEEDEEDEENEEAQKKGDMEIYDCRSQIAAVANFANGAGTENPGNYEGCSLSFLGIQNIHTVRSSLGMLRTLCNEQNVSEWRWCSSLEGTGWMCHVQTILCGSLSVAKTLHHGRSVLLHCSDGWDRTAQVAALAQLFLDPFFRSLEGFEVLVEKEWISFGHKFHDRLAPGKERYFEQNEACPVFQQWIECVWQVQRQFPDAFEFNERYLLFLVDALLSRMFGNFSYNCEKERELAKVYEKTHSVWDFVRANAKYFTNAEYVPKNEPLFPAVEMWRLRLWGGSFFRHYCWDETQDSY